MAGNATPDPDLLAKLMEMGISENTASQALIITNNAPIETTMSVALDMSDDQWEDLQDDFKMTFVVNTALGMGVGKTAAQVAHATLGLYQQLTTSQSAVVQIEIWQQKGEKKIVLKGNNAEHLIQLEKKAIMYDIPFILIKDAGLTEIPPDSVTVLALFGLEDDVNKVTKNLQLL